MVETYDGGRGLDGQAEENDDERNEMEVSEDEAEDYNELDEEEDIEIVSGVTVDEIMEYIASGEMNLVGGWGCMLAIQKLREMGEV